MTPHDKEVSTGYREAIVNDPCTYCGGRTEQMHVDHQYPLSKGGTDHWWNLTMACSHCNLTKHTWCGTRFRLYRGLR
ncbi:HNH endonuclease [Streptomyces olivaceus]|uniref:HNH endonuclease n=1 Tax=Streptomyces olivaceus TaxID=47716 RepID=UPI001CC90336|nr:HNH endonuclease signature motif containing protein [Streptomyces olivaceus]MBZ6290411.1 HNH endonuclease [Streptomyces olivaceus]MBZ6324363.1 HNH endonuclease [Streptomyces olivaceus]